MAHTYNTKESNSICTYCGQRKAPNKRIRFISSPLFTDFSISRNESFTLSMVLTSNPKPTVPITSNEYLQFHRFHFKFRAFQWKFQKC